MATVIITYKLKPGTAPEAYESWTRTRDYPAMRGLKRVGSFVTHRAERLLMGEGEPSFDYVDIFDIPDLDGFLAEDMGGDVIQAVMGEWAELVDAPEMVIASPVV